MKQHSRELTFFILLLETEKPSMHTIVGVDSDITKTAFILRASKFIGDVVSSEREAAYCVHTRAIDTGSAASRQ